MTPEQLLAHAHGYAHDLIRTADPEGEHLAGYLAEHADGTLDFADNAAICELMATCDVVIVAPWARTWSLPDEPGTEVRAVKDDSDLTWICAGGVWVEEYRREADCDWPTLLYRRGPLTNATHELSPAGTGEGQ